MGALYSGQDPPPPASTAVGDARIVPPEASGAAGPGPFVMAAETLAGDSVVNRDDEDLGTLEHVMIDVPSGTIAYAVLACGGVFGIGEKLFAVPWGAFTLDAGRQCFVLDVSKDRLDRAPGFDRDHWPAMGEPSWARKIHDYYGVRPYWRADPGVQ